MLKKIVKHLSVSSVITNSIFAIITAILMFVGIYSPDSSLEQPLYFTIGMGFIMFLMLNLLDAIGSIRHRTILQSKNFRKIQTHFNFEIENRNNYWGFKGVYKDYFIRLFYDGDYIHQGGMIGILIYYQPPKTDSGILNTRLLDQINTKFDPTEFIKTRRFIYGTSHIEIFAIGLWNIRAKKMISIIEEAMETLPKSKFKPITESQVEDLIKNNKLIHAPMIKTFEV